MSDIQVAGMKPSDPNRIEMHTGANLKVSRDALNDIESDGLQVLNRNTLNKLYLGKSLSHWVLITISSLILVTGASSATLLGRLYFVHGGSHRWLYTWIQSVGWPINLLPLFVCYYIKGARNGAKRAYPTPMTVKLFIIYLGMGLITAMDNLLYSWGISYLPVSTNALLCASQLAFNAVFAFALVGQKMTPSVVNSVFVVTMGSILLGVHAESDRPAGTTQSQYILGFIVTIAAAALYALMLTLMELIYKKVLMKAEFVVAVEAQTAISVAATAFALVGMWASGDLAAMQRESVGFKLGSGVYAVTLVGSAVGWQLLFLGGAGVIFLGSSLLTGVLSTATLPLLSILAVIFFHDKFSALKAIAMLLSMWGFICYIYGGYLDSKAKLTVQTETITTS